jgi:SAM-dependent methyltransferase
VAGPAGTQPPRRDERERWNERYGRGAGPVGLDPSAWLADHGALLEAQPRGRALDIACGMGRNALFLAGLGFHVDAVDVSDVAVETTRARAAERGAAVRAVRADVRADPFPEPPYEVIANLNFLERALFGPIAQALAPGGLLVFETFGRDQREVPGSTLDPRLTLAPNELLRAFAGLRVLHYRDTVLHEDRTRAVVSLVARRELRTRASPSADGPAGRRGGSRATQRGPRVPCSAVGSGAASAERRAAASASISCSSSSTASGAWGALGAVAPAAPAPPRRRRSSTAATRPPRASAPRPSSSPTSGVAVAAGSEAVAEGRTAAAGSDGPSSGRRIPAGGAGRSAAGREAAARRAGRARRSAAEAGRELRAAGASFVADDRGAAAGVGRTARCAAGAVAGWVARRAAACVVSCLAGLLAGAVPCCEAGFVAAAGRSATGVAGAAAAGRDGAWAAGLLAPEEPDEEPCVEASEGAWIGLRLALRAGASVEGGPVPAAGPMPAAACGQAMPSMASPSCDADAVPAEGRRVRRSAPRPDSAGPCRGTARRAPGTRSSLPPVG